MNVYHIIEPYLKALTLAGLSPTPMGLRLLEWMSKQGDAPFKLTDWFGICIHRTEAYKHARKLYKLGIIEIIDPVTLLPENFEEMGIRARQKTKRRLGIARTNRLYRVTPGGFVKRIRATIAELEELAVKLEAELP